MLITIKYDNYLYWKYTPHVIDTEGIILILCGENNSRNLNSRYHLSKISFLVSKFKSTLRSNIYLVILQMTD